MQKLKNENYKINFRFKKLSTAIRNGSNLLSILSLIYSMQHAKKSNFITGTSNSVTRMKMQEMTKKIDSLKNVAKKLQNMEEISGEEFYNNLYEGSQTYVNLFYNMDADTISKYIINTEGHTIVNINKENNLLILPAIMALNNENKTDVINFISNHLYKVPFKVLYHSTNAALQVELLEQSMGVKSIPIEITNNINNLLNIINDKTKEIEKGNINPSQDEYLKIKFLDSIINVSYNTDMKISEFISEKIMPNKFIERMARKIIRKF
ncbi:MAG: hypothetical protein ACP5RI_01945 [Candidatus Micrarchaeia archaeon]